MGLPVTLAAGGHGHIPTGGVRRSAVPVLLHHQIRLVADSHKLPDDGLVGVEMHDEPQHALVLLVAIIELVGTKEPEQHRRGTVTKIEAGWEAGRERAGPNLVKSTWSVRMESTSNSVSCDMHASACPEPRMRSWVQH